MFGDDDDFGPGASSNLAALFNKARIESGNPSLTYTPPKQPKPTGSPKSKVPPTSTSNTLDLLFVKTVQSFKLEGNNFYAQGKAGAALVGNDNTKFYQILLYKDKQNHLCSARINKDFKFMIQARNYATFYDKNKCVWSILFDSEEDIVSFGIEIALMRWNSEENCTTLIVQDLWVPEVTKDETADYGHCVQFTYTAYTLQLSRLGKEQGDGAITTAQVAKTGWEQGLLRAIADMQRIIIIPPSQLGMWKSMINDNTPIAIKLIFTSVETKNSEEIQAVCSDLNGPESSAERNVKARGASIKEALTSSSQAAKANLISRMAKMGQATLPFKGAIPTPSDSDETEEDQSVKVDGEVRTVPPPRPRVRTTNQVVTHTTSSVVSQPPAPWFPQNPYMVGGMYPQIQSPVSDPQLPVFLSEVRTHNSELRMGITRATDKIDTIITKLHHLPKSNIEYTVLENVNRISEENLLLRKEVELKLSAVQAQNEQLLKLLSESTAGVRQLDKSQIHEGKKSEVNKDTTVNESCVNHKEIIAQLELDNLELVQKYEDVQRRLKSVEEQLENIEHINESHVKNLNERGMEVERLKYIVEEQSARIESLGKENEESVDQETIINNLKEKLIKYDEEVDTLVIQLAQRDKLIDTLDKSIKEKHEVIQQLSATLDKESIERQQLEDQINKLQSQEISKLAIADEIKYVMNHVYRTLKANFSSQESYNYTDIHAILAETIKNATVQYLQQSIMGMYPSGVHHTLPTRESHHVTSSSPLAPDMRSQNPKMEYSKHSVVSAAQPVNSTQSPKIEPIKEPVVNIETDETQAEVNALHSVFGEYKNLQQRQEMEKGQTKNLSSQQSVTSNPVVSENQLPDNPVTTSDKVVSSEGGILADKDSFSDTGKAPAVNTKEIDSTKEITSAKETDKASQEGGSKHSAGVIEITLPQMESNDDSADDMWRPQPPPPPLFDEDDNEDDWLNA